MTALKRRCSIARIHFTLGSDSGSAKTGGQISEPTSRVRRLSVITRNGSLVYSFALSPANQSVHRPARLVVHKHAGLMLCRRE